MRYSLIWKAKGSEADLYSVIGSPLLNILVGCVNCKYSGRATFKGGRSWPWSSEMGTVQPRGIRPYVFIP